MALNGCLQKFDELAIEFVRAGQSESIRPEQLAELQHTAEDELNTLQDDKVRKSYFHLLDVE